MKLENIIYDEYKETRDAVQIIAQLLSAIKGKLVPHQKNWEEFSLNIYSNGFTTGSMPVNAAGKFDIIELKVNLIDHKLIVCGCNFNDEFNIEVNSIEIITESLKNNFEINGLQFPEVDSKFYTNNILIYKTSEINKLWNLFSQFYFLLMKFRGSSLFETSNINFWPHHFDMALLVFSGKIIAEQDPKDWDYSREQMNFGLSSGDHNITEPYIYITSYPFDENLIENKLPEFASWNTNGWKGMLIKLSSLVYYNVSGDQLLELFSSILNENYG